MNIAGLDKAQILLALYNGACVPSSGERRLESKSVADELIANAKAGKIPFYFDHIDLGLGPRFIGVDLSREKIKLESYDEYHRAFGGYGKRLIEQHNVPMAHLSPCPSSEPPSPNAAALITRFGGVFTTTPPKSPLSADASSKPSPSARVGSV